MAKAPDAAATTPKTPIDRDPEARTVTAPAAAVTPPVETVTTPAKPKHTPRLSKLALEFGISQEEADALTPDQLLREIQAERTMREHAESRRSAPRQEPAPSPAPLVPAVDPDDAEFDSLMGVDEEGKPIKDKLHPGVLAALKQGWKSGKELKSVKEELAKERADRTNRWVNKEINRALAERPDIFGQPGEDIPVGDDRYIRFQAFKRQFSELAEKTHPYTDAKKVIATLFGNKPIAAAASGGKPRDMMTRAELDAEAQRVAQAQARRERAAAQPRVNGHFAAAPSPEDYADMQTPAPTSVAPPHEEVRGTSAAIQAVAEIQRGRGVYVRPNTGVDELDGIPD